MFDLACCSQLRIQRAKHMLTLSQRYLNEDLLCHKSPFFRKAFQGGFIESACKEMDLPEDDPGTFGHFVGWVYGQLVSYNKQHTGKADFHYVLPFLEAYILAEAELADWAFEAYKSYVHFPTRAKKSTSSTIIPTKPPKPPKCEDLLRMTRLAICLHHMTYMPLNQND